MKVSVVVPAYNEEKYITKCLDGLMKQIEKPDEIIIVNNNSTDHTVAIAEKYPVRIVHEQEQGMIQARNRGFNEAQYAIIARTDADTIVPPDWIKKIKETFADEKIVALSGPATFYEVPSDLTEMTAMQTEKSYFILMKSALGHGCLLGPNMSIRKSAWEKIKNIVCMNNSDVHEDIDLSIHIAPIGEIKNDNTLIVNSSFRRFKRIASIIEYSYRVVKSIRKHKKYTVRARSTAFFKKIAAKALNI